MNRPGSKFLWLRGLAVLAAVVPLAGRAEAQRRPRVAEVTVAPSNAQAKAGEKTLFMASAFDASGNPLDVTFVWTSNNTAIATVDQNGMVTGVGDGTAIITARAGSGAAARMGQATITVTAPPAPVVPQGAAGQVTAPPTPRPDTAARAAGAGARPPAVAPRDTTPRAAAPVAPAAPPVLGPGSAALAKQPEGAGAAESLIVEPTSVRLPRGASRELLYHTIRANRQNAEKVPITFTVAAGGERLIRVDSVGTITALQDTGRTTLLIVVPTKRNIPPVVVSVQVGDTAAAAPAVVKGYLTVNAIPYATLSIDGVEIGDTPLVKKELAPGNHTVRLVRDGYKTETFTVKVEPGSETRVSRTLVREN